MRCTPDECEWCEPWGASVPGKAKCCKPGRDAAIVDEPGCEPRGWRYSTVLGGACVSVDKPATMRLF